MNVLTPLPDGSVTVLTPIEAAKLIAYLRGRLPRVAKPEQPSVRRMIDHLRRITAPERAYEAWM